MSFTGRELEEKAKVIAVLTQISDRPLVSLITEVEEK